MTLFKGTSAVVYACLRLVPRPTFLYHGVELTELLALYNNTWRNERGVEIPIARAFLDSHPGRVLEVGHVLGHYGITEHKVVDKYEQDSGVLNVDVTEYQPEESYDAIVSISTLEHVGWDEAPRDVEKVDRAIGHLRTLLSPSGRMLVTFALRYNAHLDSQVAARRFDVLREAFLHRDKNGWVDCEPEDALVRARYLGPVRGGSTIWIGEFGPLPADNRSTWADGHEAVREP